MKKVIKIVDDETMDILRTAAELYSMGVFNIAKSVKLETREEEEVEVKFNKETQEIEIFNI